MRAWACEPSTSRGGPRRAGGRCVVAHASMRTRAAAACQAVHDHPPNQNTGQAVAHQASGPALWFPAPQSVRGRFFNAQPASVGAPRWLSTPPGALAQLRRTSRTCSPGSRGSTGEWVWRIPERTSSRPPPANEDNLDVRRCARRAPRARGRGPRRTVPRAPRCAARARWGRSSVGRTGPSAAGASRLSMTIGHFRRGPILSAPAGRRRSSPSRRSRATRRCSGGPPATAR